MRQEIVLLRKVMKKHAVDMYLVPTADEHQSEYISDYHKFRDFLSGFTGSAGTLLITEEECLLWTDGRYYIQAEKELENSEIVLMRAGEKNVPAIEEYISSHIKEHQILAFDAALLSLNFGRKLEKVVNKNGAMILDIDLSLYIWRKRPSLAKSSITYLEEAYTGLSAEEKLKNVQAAIEQKQADAHIISSLDDIAWILNLRGQDISYNPVFYAYLIMESNTSKLFLRHGRKNVNEHIIKILKKCKVDIWDYDDFFEYLTKNMIDKKIWIDPARSSYKTVLLLKSKNEIIEEENPSVLMKAIKTVAEMDNIRYVHKIDGFVMTKFIYWIKNQMKSGAHITENDAAYYLDQLRLRQNMCMDLSFDTIAAYGENAAMCHYSPSKTNPVFIDRNGFLLVDSGGQYLTGTTDVTRTIAVGPLTQKQKEHYTLVLKGHLQLAMAVFPEGVCGANLDVLARRPLWEHGLDYNHGTGHGVGCYLNVHEGPNNIHWNLQRSNAKTTPLKIGMLTSNEPGLYFQGEYGIRIENLLLTKSAELCGNNSFLAFETVTLVPYERDAIVIEMLSNKERNWINEYHKKIYSLYAPYVEEDEKEWLLNVTQSL